MNHAPSPDSEQRPKGRNGSYVTEKTYIKRKLKALKRETRKAQRVIFMRGQLARVTEEYQRTMDQLHEGDVRPEWARQP